MSSEEGSTTPLPKKGKGLSKEVEEEEDKKPAAVASTNSDQTTTTTTTTINAKQGCEDADGLQQALESAVPVARAAPRVGAKSSSSNREEFTKKISSSSNNTEEDQDQDEELDVLKAREKAIYLSLEFDNTTTNDLPPESSSQQQNNKTNVGLSKATATDTGSGGKKKSNCITIPKEEESDSSNVPKEREKSIPTTDNNPPKGGGGEDAVIVGSSGVAAAILATGHASNSSRAAGYPPQFSNKEGAGGGMNSHTNKKQQPASSSTTTALTTDTSGNYASISRLPGGVNYSLPGAYSGAPGAGLERRGNIRKSLVGRSSSAAAEDQHQQQPSSSTTSTTTTTPLNRAILNENEENRSNNPEDESTNVPSSNAMQQEEDSTPPTEAVTTTTGALLEDNNSIDEEDVTRLGLAEATAVTGESTLDVAEPFDPKDAATKKRGMRRNGIILFFCLLIVLIIVLVSGFVGWKKSGTRNNNEDMESSSSVTADLGNATVLTSSPTASPTGFLELLVESLPASSIEKLDRFGTPQWQAMHWLENHPNLPTMEEWKKRQLFALVTFYYEMEGPYWPEDIKNNWLQYTTDECYWFSTGFGKFNFATGLWQEESRYYDDDGGGGGNDIMTPCNANDRFQLLHLMGLDLGDRNPRLPEEIALLTSLKVLSLNASHISAPLFDFLPKQLYQMTSITTLVLGENHFNGTIPSQLGLLTNLSNLFLNSNSLSGGFPTELGQLTSLTFMGLYLNHLTGTIPLELTHLSSLRVLQMWGNSLTGTIPSEIGAMSNLQGLSFDTNNLSGTIPPSLGSMPNLSQLWLFSNSLTGEIPPGFGTMVSNGSLVQLHLEDNQLTGTIAENICALAINSTNWYTRSLSFDCFDQLCGCCWCPCEGGTNSSSVDCPLSQPSEHFDPSTLDDDWPGSFPTPVNSSNIVNINIRTDEYPEETSWEWSRLEAESGGWDTLDSEHQLLEPETLFSYTMDVQSDATYRLRLYDKLGDGICCEFGFGWFSITTAAPSAEYVEGTVIWNATGEVIGKTMDIILRIDSTGFAELADSIEEDS